MRMSRRAAFAQFYSEVAQAHRPFGIRIPSKSGEGGGGGPCRSSLSRSDQEGDRSGSEVVEGQRRRAIGPSVSASRCHLPMAPPQGRIKGRSRPEADVVACGSLPFMGEIRRLASFLVSRM